MARVDVLRERGSWASPPAEPLNSWLPYTEREPSRRQRLFCLPFAGGAASAFLRWRDKLPPEVELCPIQLPGREQRLSEPAFRRLGPLLSELVPALCPYLDRPFALLGHSMGGRIAFELASELVDRSLPLPELVVISGCPAPIWPPARPLHHLEDDRLIARLRELGGTPGAVLGNAELMDLVLPTLRADLELHETYRPDRETQLTCPILALGGTRDPGVPPAATASWRASAGGSFSTALFEGDHFFIFEREREVLSCLSRHLHDGG